MQNRLKKIQQTTNDLFPSLFHSQHSSQWSFKAECYVVPFVNLMDPNSREMQYELERSTDDMKWCVVLTILCANVLRLQNVVFRGGHCVTCPHPHSFPVPRRRLSVSTHTMAGKSLNSCVFCQICGDNPSGTELLYSSDELVVFKDIKPAAKHHYLVVSREHIPDARAMSSAHKPLLEKMLAAADQVLREQGGDPADVRLGFHWPPFHSVSHLHLHVISPTADMGLIARMIFKQNSWWFVSPEYVMSRL